MAAQVTPAFEVANEFIGWGDPRPGGLFFCGIEGAAPYEDVDKLLASKGIRQVVETEFNWKKLRQKSAGIRDYTSKIAAGVSDKFHPNDWRTYRNGRLWADGGGVFQANLYPLGKPSIDSWAANYKKDFGFGPDDLNAYKTYVRETRFRELRKFRESWQPQATICFGNSFASDFKLMLGLENMQSEMIYDSRKKYLEVFEKERVIITPFFGNGRMNDELKDAVISKLKDWGVRLQ